MKREEIMSIIRDLSNSQGFYCRLYFTLRTIETDDYDHYDDIMSKFEECNFKDAVDLILYIEG